MKKIVLSVLGSVLIFGVGTVVMAAGNDADKVKESFEKMKPFMEEMHPDFSNEELKEMYDSCHGDVGKIKEQNMENMEDMDPESMMNQF
jgi:transcriptional antiterminator